MMTRTIAAASALCLGLLLPAWAAPAPGGDQLGELGPATSALAPVDAPQSVPVPTELTAFLQCKTACAPRCDIHADMLQAERCQQACELKCNGIGGK